MRRLLLMIACVGASALCLPVLGQTTDANPPDAGQEWSLFATKVIPISAVPVPGTSSTNPFTSFDIIYVDPQSQLMTLSSRSSKAVAIFNAFTDRPIGETAPTFAGVGADNPHSGPDGNVIAGDQLWAGDYPSTVRVFDLRSNVASPPQIAAINTGGTLRADEMDYDPVDHVVAVSNGDVDATQPVPFVTLISTRTLSINKQVYFDGMHGTPNATGAGIGSVLYDSATGNFLISIPQIGSDPTKGAVAVMDPVSGAVMKVFTGTDYCQAAGMAQGPGENVLIGCDPGFPAVINGIQFPPRTYVINGRSGEILATITQVGGEDEVWYNPGDHHYYTGSRDFFTSPSATSATPVLGVIDADTNRWIENVPTGPNSHSVAANPFNNHIFVPLKDPNALCGDLPGCVGIFTDVPEGWH